MRNSLKREPLFLFMGVAVRFFALVVFTNLISCDGEGTTGPNYPPDPNDPYPLWIARPGGDWYKLDQNGSELLSFNPGRWEYLQCINPYNGDLWLEGMRLYNHWLSIYNAKGNLQRKIEFEYSFEASVDSKRKYIWVLIEKGTYDVDFRKYNFRGDMIWERPAPSELVHPRCCDVYEETGDLWVVCDSNIGGKNAIFKFDENGDLLFERTTKSYGIDRNPTEIAIDQTDGSAWVNVGFYYLLKVKANGEKIKHIPQALDILDVSKKTGNVLVRIYFEKAHSLRLYNSDFEPVWEITGNKTYGTGASCAATGSWWFTAPIANRDYQLLKVDAKRRSTYERTYKSYVTILGIKNPPYPYVKRH